MGTAVVTSTDSELVARTGVGDMEAYEELCRRFADEASRVANTVANNTDEAADVVFEAFARLLVRLREPSITASEIGATLRLVIRRISLDRHLRTQHWDDHAPRADEPTGDDPEHELIRRGFDALPDEWQQALWHAEIEQKTDTTLARGLQISTTEVAARVYRAREVLRQAYLAARLSSRVGTACRPYAHNLYAFVQRKLPREISGELAAHLEHCTECREGRDVLARMVSDLRSALFVALLMPTRAGLASFVADPPGVITSESLELPAIRDHEPDDEDEQPAPAPVIPHPRHPRRRGRVVAGVIAVAATVAGAVYMLGYGDPAEPLTSVAAAGSQRSGEGQQPVGDPGAAGQLMLSVDAPAVAEARRAAVAEAATDTSRRASSSPKPDGPSGSPNAPSSSPSGPPSSSPPPDPSPSASPSPTQPGQSMPVIDAHPGSAAARPGGEATFSVRVSGAPAPQIQWQEREPGGDWADVGGATSTQLTVTVPDASADGRTYRVVVTNALGSIASEPAVLSVEFAPEVVQHPTDVSLAAGDEGYLEASASANPGMTEVRWQVREPGASSWSDVPAQFPAGASSRLKVTGDVADGSQYRAVFANELGSVTTSPATVSVSAS